MLITEVLTAPRFPWQFPYVERLIGSIRRECLDHGGLITPPFPLSSDLALRNDIRTLTKSFTGVGVMMLVDEGRLDITRRVQDYLPEFDGQLLEEKHADGTVVTHPPERPMTVWQTSILKSFTVTIIRFSLTTTKQRYEKDFF